jgi:tRNA modification GTPase
MERSRELLGGADLTLYLIDGIEGVTAEDRDFIRECTASSSGNKPPPILLLWNKADMRPFPGSAEGLSGLSIQELSAKTGEGLTGLSAAITAMLEASCSGPSGGGLAEGGLGGGESADGTQRGAAPGIGTARQKERVDAALAALEEALVLADREEPLDIIAPLLREGVNALGEITGEVSTADILEAVFSDFCVGK